MDLGWSRIDLEHLLFWLVAAITGVSAILVVVSQNIVRAAVWLLFSLGGVAGIFFLLGADLVGSTQLIVYVGGTLVLVVFGVMLTAQGPFVSMKTGSAEWAMSALVGFMFLGVLLATIRGVPRFGPSPPQPAETSMTSTLLGESLLGLEQATRENDITGLPADVKQPRQRTAYLLPFEIVSVHLLVVLIGAAYLARAKRRRGGQT